MVECFAFHYVFTADTWFCLQVFPSSLVLAVIQKYNFQIRDTEVCMTVVASCSTMTSHGSIFCNTYLLFITRWFVASSHKGPGNAEFDGVFFIWFNIDLGQHCSGYGLVPDNTQLLTEPMLTFH